MTEAILSVLSNVSLSGGFSSVSLWDYIQLYNRLNECPRPILVKFNCIEDVSSILGRYSQLTTSNSSHVVVKRGLSKEERQLESFLLKERHCLISEGVDKTHIKIRGHKLFVSTKLHGKAHSDGFSVSSYPGSQSSSPSTPPAN